MDDCVGCGDEDGVVDKNKLTRKEVDSSINMIVDPLGLLALTTIKYESLLQKFIKAGLEWVEPLQDKLAKETGAVR